MAMMPVFSSRDNLINCSFSKQYYEYFDGKTRICSSIYYLTMSATGTSDSPLKATTNAVLNPLSRAVFLISRILS